MDDARMLWMVLRDRNHHSDTLFPYHRLHLLNASHPYPGIPFVALVAFRQHPLPPPQQQQQHQPFYVTVFWCVGRSNRRFGAPEWVNVCMYLPMCVLGARFHRTVFTECDLNWISRLLVATRCTSTLIGRTVLPFLVGLHLVRVNVSRWISSVSYFWNSPFEFKSQRQQQHRTNSNGWTWGTISFVECQKKRFTI